VIDPHAVVGIDIRIGVPAVYKHQTQRCGPTSCRQGRSADNGHHCVFKVCSDQCVSKFFESIYTTVLSFIQIGIKICFTGLVFFGSPVMIDGKQGLTVLFAGRADIDVRFSALSAVFNTGALSADIPGKLIQMSSFLRIEKTFYGLY